MDLRLFSGKLEPLEEDGSGGTESPEPAQEQPGEQDASKPDEPAQAAPKGEAPDGSGEEVSVELANAVPAQQETGLPSAEPVSDRPEGGDQL